MSLMPRRCKQQGGEAALAWPGEQACQAGGQAERQEGLAACCLLLFQCSALPTLHVLPVLPCVYRLTCSRICTRVRRVDSVATLAICRITPITTKLISAGRAGRRAPGGSRGDEIGSKAEGRVPVCLPAPCWHETWPAVCRQAEWQAPTALQQQEQQLAAGRCSPP